MHWNEDTIDAISFTAATSWIREQLTWIRIGSAEPVWHLS